MLKINRKLIPESNIGKTVTCNNEWRPGFKNNGAQLMTTIPINNPSRTSPTVSITGEVYTGSWNTLTVSSTGFTETEVILTFNTSANLTNGNSYLIRLRGTIKTQ